MDSGTIRVIDALFVSKNSDGVVTTLEVADLDAETGPLSRRSTVVQPGALGPEDAEEISDDLPPNTSAL